MIARPPLPATPTAPWCELPAAFRAPELRLQWAGDAWMQGQAMTLRRTVFCVEQGLFGGDDRDEIDDLPSRQLLVALACWGGQPDAVIGTVRIHEVAPGLWWGSRLAVARDWRRIGHVGTSLIRLAVGSARSRGCDTFLAHVQAQNVALFERLGWQALERRMIHGLAHALMQADVSRYRAIAEPRVGFVVPVDAA